MEREDGSKVIVRYEDDNIVEVKYQYEYDNETESQNMLEQIKEQYKDLDFIEEIKIDDNKIEVIIKKESYENLTLEETINKYFNIKEMS